MNGFNRYRRTLEGKPVDHIPRIPILMQYAAEFIGSDYARFASDFRVLVKANEVCAKTFDFDQLSCISDLKVDILDVDHMVDMASVRESVGTGVTLCGNMDPAEGILRGDPDKIRKTMEKIYDTVGNPFMVSAGCEIPSKTPSENLHALCQPLAYKP